MFGDWVEGQLHEAQEGAKTTKDGQRKAKDALLRCLAPDDGEKENLEVPKGKFRDPAKFA